MRNNEEKETTSIGVSYQPGFALDFLGKLVSYDKRLFETLSRETTKWFLLLCESEDFDDREERLEMLRIMATLDELASATRKLTDAQLKQQFSELLVQIGVKKESEASHA